ncbi:MAG: aminotransferase class V-fold PLP-dependent enzyme [Ginsengibacter sp.]
MKGCSIQDSRMEHLTLKGSLEGYFNRFRKNVIGHRQTFESPFGEKRLMYADWTASGRAYKPIEDCIQKNILPFVGNTHTSATITGTLMSRAYEEAKSIIKKHIGANHNDVLIFCGSGMTGGVNKLQRILGLRIPERVKHYMKTGTHNLSIDETLKPVVFVTHMEHNSNHISWAETICDVEIIRANEDGNVDVHHFKTLLEKYRHRKNKIAAITACSNVTGMETPYHEIATTIHEYGGLCFVDFACSAPYVSINMHPQKISEHLDAIYFSPHKFLGGVGTPGILIFNKRMYKNTIPDQPGGGTVVYTNPWGVQEYTTDIEQREDGGTPPFLGGIKAAMCMRLKEEMGIENMQRREEEILRIIFYRFSKIDNVEVLEEKMKKRLGVISFIIKDAHYNLVVKMLNDRFGIQLRGGCSCAGNYGHLLLQVDKAKSYEILNGLRAGNLLCKPGWIRLSIHPIMTNAEIDFIMDAIEVTAAHHQAWANDYTYDPLSNEYFFKGFKEREQGRIEDWFNCADPNAALLTDG